MGPDFDDDDDQDIQELINGQAAAGGNGAMLKGLEQASKARDGKIYYEQEDEEGNVYLVEADVDDQEEEMGAYGNEDEGELNEEEFLRMMEREAAAGRGRQQEGQQQQNSTIINSS